jgi:hypothetical protein
VYQANGVLLVVLALLSSHRVVLHVVDDEEGIITLWPCTMLLKRSRTPTLQAPPMAGATQERRLLVVACKRWLGQDTPQSPASLAPVLTRPRAPPRSYTSRPWGAVLAEEPTGGSYSS